MSGIFPDSGVPAVQAANAVNTATVNCNELFYSTSRCTPRFDPASANAVISELLTVVSEAGLEYDCTKLNNLQLAIEQIAIANSGNPCVVAAATAAQVIGIDADDKVTVCIDGTPLGVNVLSLPFASQTALNAINPCAATAATAAQVAGIDADDKITVCIDGLQRGVNVLDLPFATQESIDAISPCSATPITAAEQTALDADPSTGSVTVCIPDGAGKKAVAVPLDALLSGGGAGASVDLGAGVLALEFMYGPMLAFRSVFDPVSGSPQQAFNKTGWPVTSVTVPAGATHMAFMLQNTNPIGNGMQLETQGEIRLINCVPGDVFAITPTSLLQKNGANVQLVNATGQTVVLPTNKQIVSLNAKPWILEHFTTVDTANGPSGHQYACVLCPVKVA